MAVSTVSRRRALAQRNRAAAKAKRDKIVLGVGVALLALLLVWRLPGMLSRASSSSSPAPAVTTPAVTTPTPAVSKAASKTLVKLRHQSARDPFASATTSAGPSTLGPVATPRGLHDPFMSGSPSAAPATPVTTPATTPATTPTKTASLPEKIVLGTPGGGRVATHGWILILASIPTAQGEKAATSFASKARGRVGSVSILNSSNQKPLRGGYWVVYAGPYSTLSAVQQKASSVHVQGYGSAYVRELVVYKKKS
jgi:hypothetical protein